MLVMGRWKGLGSLVALCFSMVMIINYVIPHILSGEDPVKVSLIGSVILLTATLYLTYGWNLKTHASVLSIMFSLLLTGGLSLLFVSLTRLTGYGDENATVSHADVIHPDRSARAVVGRDDHRRAGCAR